MSVYGPQTGFHGSFHCLLNRSAVHMSRCITLMTNVEHLAGLKYKVQRSTCTDLSSVLCRKMGRKTRALLAQERWLEGPALYGQLHMSATLSRTASHPGAG
jgi:hypothetical protein